ncbi:proline racemase family protein [Georgenia sp. TF02-10]|uniref:proline racemase family protein n=1 Tax=Georgenia sp. TF02-10 TaxID=2917725 RepID=UPI002111E718|nr:proline racemase family protein [Georgenia sp. TF02-10]
MTLPLTVTAVDYHTAGEPFRIVTGGVPEVPGTSVADRRVTAQHDPELDRYRQLLVREPRGHADMYGGFLVPPDDDGADLGVLFWHKDGYSTACGHGTIALGVWAVEHGVVPAAADGDTDVVIDVPSGRVRATVHRRAGAVTGATFVNVPSWTVARDLEVATPLGTVRADVSYGGALYASVPAAPSACRSRRTITVSSSRPAGR